MFANHFASFRLLLLSDLFKTSTFIMKDIDKSSELWRGSHFIIKERENIKQAVIKLSF